MGFEVVGARDGTVRRRSGRRRVGLIMGCPMSVIDGEWCDAVIHGGGLAVGDVDVGSGDDAVARRRRGDG